MYELKKNGKVFTSKSVGTVPSSYEKNLPGRGLTKVEKHCCSACVLNFYALTAVNPLTPNDHYRGRTTPLTSKRCILYIYSTNIGTGYFKRGIYSPFFLFKMQFVS